MAHQQRLPGWWLCKKGEISLRKRRAAVVRKMIEWARSGMTDSVIAAQLTRLKKPTWGSSIEWSRATVGKILRDERLATEPSVTSATTFEELQRARSKKPGRGGADGANVYGDLLWSAFDAEQPPGRVVRRWIRKKSMLRPESRIQKYPRLWSFASFDSACRLIVGEAVGANLENAPLRVALRARVARINIGFLRETKFIDDLVNSIIKQFGRVHTKQVTACLKCKSPLRGRKIIEMLDLWASRVADAKKREFTERRTVFGWFKDYLLQEFLGGKRERSECGVKQLQNLALRLIHIEWRLPAAGGEFARIGAVLDQDVVAVGRFTPYASFWRFSKFSTALVDPGTVPDDVILPPILPLKKSAATVA